MHKKLPESFIGEGNELSGTFQTAAPRVWSTLPRLLSNPIQSQIIKPSRINTVSVHFCVAKFHRPLQKIVDMKSAVGLLSVFRIDSVN